jgi:hypothetical protein
VARGTVARQRPRNKQLYNIYWEVTTTQGRMFPRQQQNTAIIQEIFSSRSVPRFYKNQLAVAISSSAKMLHKEYDRKGSLAKKYLCL